MKICFLSGASTIHTVRWVNAMSSLGHKVSLITLQHPELDKIDESVDIYELPIKNKLGYYLNVPKVKKLLGQIKPDIVNAHYASGYGTLARMVNFQPTLLSVWGSDVYDFPYSSKLNMKIIRKNLQAATRIASTSFVMKTQTEELITPAKPIYVTPFGVDLKKFKPSREKQDIRYITIGNVKKLEEKYGIRYLVEAVSILLEKLRKNNFDEIANKIRLLIVGGGSQKEELEELSKNLMIDQITKLVGPVAHDEVPNYLNKLDIYCSPSTLDSESFGVAIIEASACELPVVVSNVGGLPEVVKNGETGLICKAKNSEDLAKKLYELVINEDIRIKMGKLGRQHVLKEYDWNKNVKLMESIYLEMVTNWKEKG
jgi:glycosyltransferase involved in cell wall biosynthesis